MRRRDLFKIGAGGLGMGLLKAPNLGSAQANITGNGPGPLSGPQFSVSIREYLSNEARKITNSALSEYTRSGHFPPHRRRAAAALLGNDGFLGLLRVAAADPLNVTVTGTIERPKYRIEKLYSRVSQALRRC